MTEKSDTVPKTSLEEASSLVDLQGADVLVAVPPVAGGGETFLVTELPLEDLLADAQSGAESDLAMLVERLFELESGGGPAGPAPNAGAGTALPGGPAAMADIPIVVVVDEPDTSTGLV